MTILFDKAEVKTWTPKLTGEVAALNCHLLILFALGFNLIDSAEKIPLFFLNK